MNDTCASAHGGRIHMNCRIAICDDEAEQAEKLTVMVSGWADQAGHSVLLQDFASAEEFLFEYGGGNLFDILLLDVEMHSMNGIALAKHIRKADRRAEIIFVTSHAEFIGEGYEVDALHYLLKPVTKEKLSEVLDRAVQRLSAVPAAIIIQCGGELVRLAEEEILYVESFLHYIQIHTVNGEYKIKEKISSFQEKLSDMFFRIHRSYLVSLRHIVRISRTGVTLEGNICLPLSRGQYDAVNRAFISKN